LLTVSSSADSPPFRTGAREDQPNGPLLSRHDRRVSAERERLAAADAQDVPWRRWGPYVSERQWGTVREDYGDGSTTWDYISHDMARSRAYRWGEDGLAGVCDDHQTWCLALALWNGADPILKERLFGLTGPQGNHGEDVKETWWYVDATPTSSWLRWRYHYPQREFPYDDLAATNAERTRNDPEYELADTGVFADDRFWVVTVDYAKADVHDLLMRITVENAGPDEATIDVLPTLWFRNTWTWGNPSKSEVPTVEAVADEIIECTHHTIGGLVLDVDDGAELLFCENESNAQRLWRASGETSYPKDGINDHVVHGAATVNPARVGTKAAARYRLTVASGASATVRVRLRSDVAPGQGLGADFDDVMAQREREADDYYNELLPTALTDSERLVARRAFAGMLWGKQFYRYDVDRWLDGDPAEPTPPASRLTGRNSGWRHLDSRDIISMPDKWEYPWFAAWDLAFHCVTLAHLDSQYAKDQLLLLCREWYMHPNGQLPAYEWNFGDVNPPVHAWAALQVFEIDGSRDHVFLEQMFHKLLLNFTWWVNRKDAQGNNVFEGGFLGLDNIGPIDRSAPPPVPGHIEQTDGTAWMAMFCLNLLEIAMILAAHDPAYEPMTIKFAEHFAYISTAIYTNGLWDEDEGFFYDVLAADDGRRFPLKVRSMVGLLTLCASMTLGQATLERLPDFAARMAWFIEHRSQYARGLTGAHVRDGFPGRLLSIVTADQLPRILAPMFDESEFLSPHGLRSLSACHREHPFVLNIDDVHRSVDYEPAESRTPLYGGNSNWRGPVWMPVNQLLIDALGRLAQFYGDDYRVDYPTGSGQQLTFTEIADDLANRLVTLFPADSRGNVTFYEYFHGDTGQGLGASHQTGWTGLIAHLLMRRATFTSVE
jgi:hypothetical protein